MGVHTIRSYRFCIILDHKRIYIYIPIETASKFIVNSVNCNLILGPHVLVLFVCVFCDSFLCSISLLLSGSLSYVLNSVLYMYV